MNETKVSAKAKEIAEVMGNIADDCGRYESFDRKYAAVRIGQMLGTEPNLNDDIARLESALEAERDCVLRLQRQLNKLNAVA